MRGYGYEKGADAETPLALQEVTIQAGAKELRELAGFLLHAAEQIEQHGEKFGHAHFEDFLGKRKVECRFIVSARRRARRVKLGR